MIHLLDPTRLPASDAVKRGVLIFTFGLLAAAVGYCCVYRASTSFARSLQKSDRPELAWLQQEFNLNDAEFKPLLDDSNRTRKGFHQRSR